jgi:hypothetical protein
VARGTRLPPVADLGTRFAFDRRPPALPVRSAFAGVSVAIIGLVGCITFSATLNRFVTSPRRWGYGWDLNAPGNRETALDAHSLGAPAAIADARRVANTRGVAAAAVLSDSFTSYRGTNGTLAWGLAPVVGRVGYALRSGRQPVGPDEMVVGPETAKHFHFHIGSEVPVDNVSGHRNSVRVVGVALFPPLDSGTFNDSVGFSATGFDRHVEPDSVTRRVAVRLAPHADRAAVARELTHIVGAGRVAATPTRPGDVDNVASLRRFPAALAFFVGLLGLGALAHIVFSTGRRRRLELATLRSIGFTRGQTGGCLVWQSLTVTIAALLVGVPLGIVVGDRVWQAATDSLGTATDPLYPALGILLVVVGACVLAVGIGAPVGWRVTRTSPARVLHGE